MLNPVAPMLDGLSACIARHESPDLHWYLYSFVFVWRRSWSDSFCSSISNRHLRRAFRWENLMSDVALRMEHIYKKFRKGETYNSLRDLLPALTGRMFRGQELDTRGSARILGAAGHFF